MDAVTQDDIAKLLTELAELKSRVVRLERADETTTAHLMKTTERLAGAIDDTNVRLEKVREYAKLISDDMFKDGTLAMNYLARLDLTVAQLQAHIMPTVTAFEAEVADIVGLPSYVARERRSAPPMAGAGEQANKVSN